MHKRGLQWKLTFEQWLEIWKASGKLSKRGKRSAQYCMARYGDSGSYSVDNVRIITCRQNHLERDHSAVAAANVRRMKDPKWRKKVKALGLARVAEINASPEMQRRRLAGIRAYWGK